MRPRTIKRRRAAWMRQLGEKFKREFDKSFSQKVTDLEDLRRERDEIDNEIAELEKEVVSGLQRYYNDYTEDEAKDMLEHVIARREEYRRQKAAEADALEEPGVPPP
jgi:ATP-dependent Clp protease ATP-binding subunit ClpA